MLFNSRSDNITAFEQLIKPHVAYLANLARYFCHNNDDADDVTQDVLFKLYRHFERWKDADNPRPYMARAIYHQFIDHGRSNKRHSHSDPIEEEQMESEPSHDNRPDLAVEHEITSDRIRHALSTLNEDQRTVIVLHDIQGFTYEEIGNIQDVPLGTVKSRHNRARRALAMIL